MNVVASTLFGGISGSAIADASAIGGIMIPQMEKRGYAKDYSVNVTVNAAIIALLIPPSHNMIIYSIAAGGTISVADLFTAGIVPGLSARRRPDDHRLCGCGAPRLSGGTLSRLPDAGLFLCVGRARAFCSSSSSSAGSGPACSPQRRARASRLYTLFWSRFSSIVS